MAESLKYLLIVISTYIAGVHAERSFDKYSVIRIDPTTEDQLHYLAKLESQLDNDRRYYQKFDFWQRPLAVNASVDLMLAPEFRDNLIQNFRERNLKTRVLINNVEK